MSTEGRKRIRDKLFSSAPSWIWSIAGALSLLSFAISVSFRMVDFNPGPLWEKDYELKLEMRREQVKTSQELYSKIKELEERLKHVESLAHQEGK